MRIGITERGDGGLDQSWRRQMKNVDGAIVITKAPQLLANTDIPENVIIHCTITGFGGSKIEPNVAKPEKTIEAWKQLKMDLGQERVVLRIDPIIAQFPEPAIEIAKHASPNDRIRISFMDAYSHAIKRFKDAGIKLNQLTFHANMSTRQQIVESLPNQIEICAEPGFKCTGCISQRDLNAMNITCKSRGKCTQRKDCNCIAEKTEMLTTRGQCKHGCLYCYWK